MGASRMIEKAKMNDPDAFEGLVHMYQPYIEKLAFQFGIRPDSIADVVQETFIKIHQNLHQFEKGKFTTWIYQITLNVVRDHYRKKKREWRIFNKVAEEENLWLPKTFQFKEIEYATLHEAVKKLDEKYRIPIILFYFHDQSYEEIAEIMNIKLANVKTRMHRGRNRLKTIYEQIERKEGNPNGRQEIGPLNERIER